MLTFIYVAAAVVLAVVALKAAKLVLRILAIAAVAVALLLLAVHNGWIPDSALPGGAQPTAGAWHD